MNFDNYKFRASSVGKIMTNGRGTSEMGETCKSYLKELIREEKWNRRHKIDSKYLRKGNACEEESINLYNVCRFLQKRKPTCGEFRKNEINLSSDYNTGTLDITDTNDTNTATEIIDIKTSYDWTTFPYKSDSIDTLYWWQLQTYLSLVPTAKQAILAHCLVNLDGEAYLKQQERLAYQYNAINGDNEQYIKACIELELNSIYDLHRFMQDNPHIQIYSNSDTFPNIPELDRVREVIIEKDDEAIERMHARVIECRNWMNKYHDII